MRPRAARVESRSLLLNSARPGKWGGAFFLLRVTLMDKTKLAVDPLPPIDRLMSRPDAAPLPTTLDPGGPEAHGYPADPKPVAKKGKGDPEATDPAPGDLSRSA